MNRNAAIRGLKEEFARETCQEFLAWLEDLRQFLIGLFRAAYDEELMLQDRWHLEILQAAEPFHFDTPTLKRLCVIAVVRQRLEHALNLIDVGGGYGPVNWSFRRRLIEQWIQNTKLTR